MNIIFDWLPQIKPSMRAAAEMKIRNDIQESGDFKPYHTGPISVSTLSSDPLEVSIKGSMTCKCGKMLASFNGSSDGSTLNYVFAGAERHRSGKGTGGKPKDFVGDTEWSCRYQSRDGGSAVDCLRYLG